MPAAIIRLPVAEGRWCLGHDVRGQAESLRTGHFVEAHLVDLNFTPNTHGDKTLVTDYAPRCNHCRSIRRWHHHHENAERRVRQFRKEHADRWVKLGRKTSTDEAFTEMDIGGVTEQALIELVLAAIDEECPGLCAYEKDGKIIRHKIKSVAGLHIDVKDPTQPLTIENIQILCESCNPAKSDEPWGTWIYKRRAQLRAWQDAIANPSYRRPEQLDLGI